MEREKLKKIIEDIKSVSIAVIGDFCLDSYWFIDESKSEISVETGLPTHPVKQQRYFLGGAGNVAGNLAAMGVKDVLAFGVIGADPFGNEMVNVMNESGIKTNNIIVQPYDWSTHVYIKPYTGDLEQNRIDFGNFNRLSMETSDLLIERLTGKIREVDLVIINEQVISGINTQYLRSNLVKLIGSFPEKIFIADSRNYCDSYDGAFRKMNDTEAVRLCSVKKDPGDVVLYSEVKEAAFELFKRYGKPLFITRGERGSLIVNDKGVTDVCGLMILSRIDTVGAGDSYLAGAAATLAAGYEMEIAAEIGTYVAGVTVQKLFQTGTASPQEILQIGENADFIYNPELAEDIRHAKYYEDTQIELVGKLPDNLNITHAIFDHDGTISTLREGWEHIMEPMMIKAILGKKFNQADDALYHKVQARVADYIDKTTGIQTLAQMKGLTELVREFMLVPESEIFDEFGYKDIYNNELLKMVRDREARITRGELGLEDFTMKNAVLFLKILFESGIKLYLASGTDEEDVKNEALIMGYANIFEGGIYGSVGDITKDAKRIVLDRILTNIGDSRMGQVVTFGDGPVEIRETRKKGGITVGIASNEVKRHSLNTGKRSRLIKAGADIIAPDFSQMESLLTILGIKK